MVAIRLGRIIATNGSLYCRQIGFSFVRPLRSSVRPHFIKTKRVCVCGVRGVRFEHLVRFFFRVYDFKLDVLGFTAPN